MPISASSDLFTPSVVTNLRLMLIADYYLIPINYVLYCTIYSRSCSFYTATMKLSHCSQISRHSDAGC